MNTQALSIPVSTSIGSVSGVLVSPENSTCVMTLAHGAGAGMNHAFMSAISQSLAHLGIATLRFNFPFAEQKKGRPDVPAVAHKTIEAAILLAGELMPSLPLFVAGKSFGGRMSSQYLSAHSTAFVRGIVFFGFPLHAPGQPGIERAEHLKSVTIPMLFLQGTRDALATLHLMETVCESLPSATLSRIEGADHSFKAGKRDTLSELSIATKEWISNIIGA